ncbi:MAG: hypothetical protein ABI639_13650 [Thermoanaerobaculia bacterium]
MTSLRRAAEHLVREPFVEIVNGLDAVLGTGMRSLGLVAIGLVAGWWLYVPAHELLHAFGCWIAGGEVSRLEIDPMYGAKVLALVFPFVVPGRAYAGRLSGFDTGGNDWIYLATDLAPFLLTLFPGFWWLRRSARTANAMAFGAALPLAFAPLISLTGDAYEIASLAVVHLPPWQGRRELVADDLLANLAALLHGGSGGLVAGALTAAFLGLFWALVWIAAAREVARRLGQVALAPR